MYRILILSSLAIFLLVACGPTLQRSGADPKAIAEERSEQMRLAREIRQKRERRLNEVAVRLAPHARDLCEELLDRRATECTYQYELLTDNSLNAAADGKTVYINTGMMRFVENDDELAVIVGHEIAHNMLDHIGQKRGAAILGAIVDGLIAGATGVNTQGAFSRAAANAYSQEYEAEADYLGVYLAERAGYDITVAPDLWRRMGIENPSSIAGRYGATHPSTPERAAALSSAIQEIGIKNIEGIALVPNRLDDKVEQSGEPMIAVEPTPRADHEPASLAQRDNRYVPPKPQVIGKWAFQAERYAMEQGCTQSGGAPAPTALKQQEQFFETYESTCASGAVLSFRCELGGCSP